MQFGRRSRCYNLSLAARGSLHLDSDPATIMQTMHQSLQQVLPPRAFVAMSFSLLDTGKRTLTVFNAGLPDPLLVRNRKAIPIVTEATAPLGTSLSSNYRGESVNLETDDTLLFFTDGFSEAQDAHGIIYEFERLPMRIAQLATRPRTAQFWIDSLLTDVQSFAADGNLQDDLTLVVMRVSDRNDEQR